MVTMLAAASNAPAEAAILFLILIFLASGSFRSENLNSLKQLSGR
jgi:hypothetical protein